MRAIDGSTVAPRLVSLGACSAVSGNGYGWAIYRLAYEQGHVLSLSYGGRRAWFEFIEGDGDGGPESTFTRAECVGQAFARCHQVWQSHQERARLLAAGYAVIGGW